MAPARRAGRSRPILVVPGSETRTRPLGRVVLTAVLVPLPRIGSGDGLRDLYQMSCYKDGMVIMVIAVVLIGAARPFERRS